MESLNLLVKIIKRFDAILKLSIKIDLFHNDILTCMCWISPFSLSSKKKKKVICLSNMFVAH